jgi:hypothetical protein
MCQSSLNTACLINAILGFSKNMVEKHVEISVLNRRIIDSFPFTSAAWAVSGFGEFLRLTVMGIYWGRGSGHRQGMSRTTGRQTGSDNGPSVTDEALQWFVLLRSGNATDSEKCPGNSWSSGVLERCKHRVL